jgi:hypothetical protein
VKEDLFMHSSCIEHFVIRAKLMDLNELELIGVTQQKAYSQLPICLLGHRNDRDSPRLGEICSLGAGQEI